MTLALAAERCCWPDQAAAGLEAGPADPLAAAVLQGRLQQWSLMEALLLAALPGLSADRLDLAHELLCGLRLRRKGLDAAEALIDQSPHGADPQHQGWWLCRSHLALQQGQPERLLQAPPPPGSHPLLGWLHVQALILGGALVQARRQASGLAAAAPPFPEALLIQAQLLRGEGQPLRALELLRQLLSRSPGEEGVWALAVLLLRPQPEQRRIHLAQALSRFPASASLRHAQVEDDLQGRRSCRGRRGVLLARLHAHLAAPSGSAPFPASSDTNLLVSYDHTARGDLMLQLDAGLRRRLSSNPEALANQALQLASLQAPSYPAIVQALVAALPGPQPLACPDRGGRPLRVALVSPDLRYHPVGRFLYMALRSGLAAGGELHLVDTSRRAPGVSAPIETFASEAAIPLHRLGLLPVAEQLAHLRALAPDVAVDLAGWSSQNAGALFASRLAPLQINYLGYFASSGLPAMDGWLGDAQLFPEPMREWHSERILRLPRCFLAWQPVPELPEGQVAVPAARPSGQPIHFGSFNHARKLTAATLGLWGRILAAVPGSRLVLKSFTSDDPGVVTLLCRRMRHCGLDPERVVWLPTCPSPLDHLRQYGLLDVALDPFPNGGCTTSCEALWMGVPVITLAGDHYASRMATAVLHGAGQQAWVAASEAAYLQLAVQAADRLSQLRAGREKLRRQLQASPLGDGADFCRAFWELLELEALP